MTDTVASILLPVLLGLYLAYAVADSSEYRRFVALRGTDQRQQVLKKWLIQSFCIHGLLSLLCLALLGQFSALLAIPEPLRDLSEQLAVLGNGAEGDGRLASIVKGLRLAFLPALVLGVVGIALLRPYIDRHQAESEPVADRNDPRDLQPLIPRNRKERLWTTLLAVNAGLSEEMAFRLLLPLLFWQVFESVVVALIVPTVMFGVAHLYQGKVGILATSAAGAFFMFVYILTGSIWTVVVLHAVIDLGTLSIAPWFADRLAKRRLAQN